MARKWKPEHKEKARREGLALISITIDARFVPKDVRRDTVIGSAEEVGIEGTFELSDVESLWKWFLSVTRPAKARG